MDPVSWLYILAMRKVGMVGRPNVDDVETRQGWLRRVSVVFRRWLVEDGVDFGVEKPRAPVAPARRVPCVGEPAALPEPLSGHVPTRIVPHGWTVEADIREEWLALSELTATRKNAQEQNEK